MQSYYTASTAAVTVSGTLQGDQNADICIIGAGYTGLSSALHLAERGYSVIVLEAETTGHGASGRNGGHVGNGQRKDQNYLEKQFGEDIARLLWDMGLEAVDTVKQLINSHGIDCDLKQGILHLAHKKKYCGDLQHEVTHLRDRYSFDSMRYVTATELNQFLDVDAYYGGLLDSASLHLHPLKYCMGLAAAALKAGVKIYEHSRVTGYTQASPSVVSTASGRV